MNCKPGDLCILLRCTNSSMKHLIGQIHRANRLSSAYPDSWLFEPPLHNIYGATASWKDADMRPIGDPSGEDETLQWSPIPGQKVEA